MQILTPIQDPDASQLKPYAGEASQKFQQLLMLVQAPNTSNTNPYACTGSQIFKLLTPGQPPKNSNTSLCQCRLMTLHIQILMLVQAPNASHENPYTCTGY
ncbi:hypothetical protein O181_092586 [Austropuccinia psidii MF-1]|uniref:Uncharacterized protein n=1 Tax=Austropuccinia psidii MF-1 TaxID=1389203 RepID=A0A9Q3IZT1_9BASI|nr:hypothetical protein [Austropuccinia psidii MF-1]